MAAENGKTNGHARTYTRRDWTDLYHTGPDTLAGRYFRRFWQPINRSEDLAVGRSTPIRFANEDFTLYRGESGKPYVVAFRCAHRGTQLSTGWVEGDDIRCFYHGWRYGGDEQCVEQPAEAEPFWAKIRIRNCPTQDYLAWSSPTSAKVSHPRSRPFQSSKTRTMESARRTPTGDRGT